jgi:hypothetical protein
MGLVACPFCRELFKPNERASCPVCGMKLESLAKLPLSHDAVTDGHAITAPEMERLPFHSTSRGRGWLVGLAACGLAFFLLPWVHRTLPDDLVLTGAGVAGRLGWPWACGVAWFLLIPFTLSRRTPHDMATGRVAVAFLAAIPGVTAIALFANPPRPQRLPMGLELPLKFTWGWALYATLATSIVAIVVACAFGGKRWERRGLTLRLAREHCEPP